MYQNDFISFLEALSRPNNQTILNTIHKGYKVLTESRYGPLYHRGTFNPKYDALDIGEESLTESASTSLSDYGQFSEDSDMFFHGFHDLKTMIAALERGWIGHKEFGGLTSIGTPKSHTVPYKNRIWFTKPTNIKIYPKFYMEEGKGVDSHKIAEIIAKQQGFKTPLDAEVGPISQADENEWYHDNIINIKDLPITKIEYLDDDKEKIQKIKEMASTMNVPVESIRPLQESLHTTKRMHLGTGLGVKNIAFYKNPRTAEVSRMLKTHGMAVDSIRGIINNQTDDVFIWAGETGLHHEQALTALDIPYVNSIYFMYSEDDKFVKVYELSDNDKLIKYIPQLKRMFPNTTYIKTSSGNTVPYEKSLTEAISPNVTIYRGVSTVSPVDGHYYSTDKEWARQFTQSGRDSEIITKSVPINKILKLDPLPSANNETQFDMAMEKAKEKNYPAVWMDEGSTEPNSVFVLNKNIFLESMDAQEYSKLNTRQRRQLREQYIIEQNGKCMFCFNPLESDPPDKIKNTPIDWSLFPEGFLKAPVHLQHNHDTDMTEGVVHAYCNAYMWQYEGR